MDPYVHLHVHSHYSLLDGCCKIEELVEAAKTNDMPALALTDHGNLFGAIEFYLKAKDKDIKPIIGYEAYVAPGSRFEKKAGPGSVSAHHLTLLVKNKKGYQNLLKLATAASLEGFYYKPRIDKELLQEHSEGLIGLSGCLSSELSKLLLHNREKEAEKVLSSYRDLFEKDSFYVELQNNGLTEQEKVVEGSVQLARKMKMPIVATSDVHYIHQEDALVQEILLCINTGKTIDDPNRMTMKTDQFYFRSPKEMRKVFSEFPDALENTWKIVGECNLELKFEQILPHFKGDSKEDNRTFFRRLCEEGCRNRYSQLTRATQDRLHHEMKIIEENGLVNYFLIVWDFIRFAKENAIPVGPGRGSAAGSIVAYSLGITNVDPLKYDLLFERFLNSERISMPDIDIDFCKDKREQVIRYVREKYGEKNVAQIITFGTLAARGVLRDVGRVLNVPLPEVDALTKKIPSGPGVTLKDILEKDGELKNLRKANPTYRRLFDIAVKLEGKCRHASTHAAGIVITDKPLENYTPLYKVGEDITTQFSMNDLEKIGLLKMDFLGLKTLTIIEKAIELVEKNHGVKLNQDAFQLNDEKTYECLSRGDSLGIFQLESEGMRDLLQKMKPDCFQDLVAILALYRPGPLGSGMVDAFIRCKHGLESIQYKHSLLEPILKETNGVILYQEQVMRIANRLAGFSLNEADILRKAMGKKLPEIIEQYKEKFISGAEANGIPMEIARDVYTLIEYFAGYGFNKSHSTAYALISYQTAFLKANYPLEFMCALMTCERQNSDKLFDYIKECRKMHLDVLPPHMNKSFLEFTCEGGDIRFGLGAIKNLGDKATEAIEARRGESGGFDSLQDFCESMDQKALNRQAIESLVKSGAFDYTEYERALLLSSVDSVLRSAARVQEDRRRGQMTLFGTAKPQVPQERGLPTEEESELQDSQAKDESLLWEKEAFGFFFSGHPVEDHLEIIERFSTHSTGNLVNLESEEEVILGGVISGFRFNIIKEGKNKGEKMAFFKIDDLKGSCEAVIFPKDLMRYSAFLDDDAIHFFQGRIDLRREHPSLKVSQVIPLEKAPQHFAQGLQVSLDSAHQDEDTLGEIKVLIQRYPGSHPLFFVLEEGKGGRTMIKAGTSYTTSLEKELLEDLKELVGKDKVAYL